MTYSNRLVWPQQWHTQTRCADGLLLLHIYSADYLYAPTAVNCEVGSTRLLDGVLPTSQLTTATEMSTWHCGLVHEALFATAVNCSAGPLKMNNHGRVYKLTAIYATIIGRRRIGFEYATVAAILKPDAPTAYCCCIYTVWTTYTRPRLLIVRWGVPSSPSPACCLHEMRRGIYSLHHSSRFVCGPILHGLFE